MKKIFLSALAFFSFFLSCKKDTITDTHLHTEARLVYSNPEVDGCGFELLFDSSNYKFTKDLDSSFKKGGLVKIEYAKTNTTTTCSWNETRDVIKLYTIEKKNW